METPDDKGFIHVSWPSKRVPHGGIFHAKVAEPSLEQQNFLKVLLEESKLTIAQRRKGAYTLRQDNEEKNIVHEKKETPMIRPRTSRRRSLSAIRESGIFEIDEYRPVKRGEDRDKLKDILVNQMAYGGKEQRAPPPPPTRFKRQSRLPTKKEQWNDLVTQIRERADWLADMEYLGQGGPHRDLVKDQIAERLRALDTLGIDSQCCTARSTASALSARISEHSARSKASVASSHSRRSISTSGDKSKIRRPAVKSFTKEENVSEYEMLTPLHIQYSPRRRV